MLQVIHKQRQRCAEVFVKPRNGNSRFIVSNVEAEIGTQFIPLLLQVFAAVF